jgi:glutamate dehydrogenase
VILAARAGEAASDALNALILTAGLRWREVDVLRAYAEYAFQLKVIPSRISAGLGAAVPPDSRAPAGGPVQGTLRPGCRRGRRLKGGRRVQTLREALLRALDDVTPLNDDRVLRRLLVLLDATVRTNYFVHGGSQPTARAGGVPYISFKFLSELLQPLAPSRLRAEIWVHSVRMAGIHMRRGKVSRGGLRHSDRPTTSARRCWAWSGRSR